jgi:hypothetical protein
MNSNNPENTNGVRPIVGENRIVAPNVSKLSPFSAVEVRLQSNTELIIVLCSVDVLKMRSGFFHDILTDQENTLQQRGNMTMTASSPANASSNTTTPGQGQNVLWRDPIVIPEQSPYEAAAFLESLHEGRTLFRGEWNYCWARLR